MTYEIEIAVRGTGYVILNETLAPSASSGVNVKWIDNRPGRPQYFDTNAKALILPNWDYNENEPMLGQVPKTHTSLERYRRLLGETRLFTYLDVGKHSACRLPQRLTPDIHLPGPNGENLISALYNLRAQDEGTYQRVLESVQAVFPGFQSLEFPLVAAGKATMIWKEDDRKLWPHQMSEGTLRFLWLSTLLLSRKLPPITLIDEPEVSLHPEVLQVLAGLLEEASQSSVVFVATHSDRLIRWLKPEEILILDRSEGCSTLRRADSPALNLEEWLKDYTLDELGLMGELGGRP